MDTFAFITHPADINQVIRNWGLARFVPTFLLKEIIRRRQPFKLADITNVKSISGVETKGYFIALPLLPEQILKLNYDLVFNKVILAGRIAENLGAKILGLGAYTSVFGDKGISVAKELHIAVTTGNSYTVATVIKGILKASRLMNINLSKAKLAVIGATGSIGKACVKILADRIPHIIINARHQDRLEELKSFIQSQYSTTIKIEKNSKEAVRDADLVITTSSAPTALIDANDLKKGAVACDVSVPKNISRKTSLRNDVLIFDGGLVEVPSEVKFGVNTGLAKNLIHACVAEVMILALSRKFEDYSLGDNLDLLKIEEISALAKMHGFKIAEIQKEGEING